MPRNIIIAVLFSLYMGTALPARALEIVMGDGNTVAPRGTTLTAEIPSDPLVTLSFTPQVKEARIGDPIDILVKITGRPGVTPGPLNYGETIGDWQILGVHPGQPAVLADGQYQRVDRLVVAGLAPGEQDFVPPVVKFNLPNGKPAEYRPASFKLKLLPLPKRQGDLPGQWRGLKGQIYLVSILYILLALLLLAGAGAAIWWLARKRRASLAAGPAAPPRPPEIVARERLAALRDSGWAGADSKRFYSELSDILRRYIEGRFGIPAVDRTTSELYKEMRGANLKRQELGAAKDVLENSDMVKFAKARPEAEEGMADWQTVSAFVEQTTAAPAPAVPPAAGGGQA